MLAVATWHRLLSFQQLASCIQWPVRRQGIAHGRQPSNMCDCVGWQGACQKCCWQMVHHIGALAGTSRQMQEGRV
jgi:hypothetical protein